MYGYNIQMYGFDKQLLETIQASYFEVSKVSFFVRTQYQ